MSKFYPNPIDLAQIKKDSISTWTLDESTQVAVAWLGEEIKVFRDFCPHMGAKFSDGKLCADTDSVQCPWHGYLFSLKTGEFWKNPNDEIFAKMKNLYKCYDASKTPKYRLALMTFEMIEGKAHVYKRTAASVGASDAEFAQSEASV